MTRLPPGPRFGLLQTVRYISNPYAMLRAVAAQYGDIFSIRTGRAVVMTGKAALIRRIISAPAEQYGLIKETGSKRIFGESGMTNLEGRALRRDRKLMLPSFQGAALTGLGPMMRDAAMETVSGWTPGQVFTMRDTALSIALDVILRTVFGADTPQQRDDFREAVRRFSEAFGNKAFLLLAAFQFQNDGWPPYRHLAAARDDLEKLLQGAIDRARAAVAAGAQRTDILGLLVAARYEDGTGLSDAALRDNLVTTLLAGHETSVVSLCWAMFWLHRDPACLDRVMTELNTVGPDATPAQYAALPYLDAVVKETLRLWPVVPDINRVLAMPMELGGWDLPKGAVVAGCAAILHYDPELYPEPDRFRPERFLERRFAAHEYIPFGGGERMCPGAQFSSFELKIILATLLSRGRFTLLDPAPPPMKRVGFLMAPKSGVPMRYDGPRAG